MKSFIRIALVALGAATIAAGPAAAATFKVASSGTDSGTCGAAPNPPCLTIQQAVTNAADGDSIQVGPGSYAGVSIGKKLKLWSSNGTGGAVITSQMTLAADGIVFGLLGKGFALDTAVAPPNTGILVTANEVTVRGNRLNNNSVCVAVNGNDAIIRDNTFNGCSNSIEVAGANAQVRGNLMGYSGSAGVSLLAASTGADVRENRMFGPSGSGIMVDGADHLVRRNVIQGAPGGITSVPPISGGNPTGVQLVENVVSNSLSLAYQLSSGSGWVLTRNAALGVHAAGFYLTAGTTFTLTGNVAVGDGSYGIYIYGGSGHTLIDNTGINSVGNGAGIYLVGVGTGVTISGGNVYGNGNNCGVYNDVSSSPVTADKVFWGAASGPGADPADAICGTGTVNVTNPASKPAVIKIPSLK